MASVLMVGTVGDGGGLWTLKSSASSFYLEIIELDCDEVVAALS